jgi:protein-disulfide isomerase
MAGMVAVVLCAQTVFMARAQVVKVPVASGKTFGVVDARVQIEEYTDFQCPGCANAAVILHEEMKKEGARIFVEVKYFPLPMHKHARAAAVAAQCALEQNKFWAMQSALFRTQEIWSVSLARGLGTDDRKMMRCMSDKATELKIDEDVKEGKRLGVNATPTFFVNGKMAVGGVNFQAALKEALK